MRSSALVASGGDEALAQRIDGPGGLGVHDGTNKCTEHCLSWPPPPFHTFRAHPSRLVLGVASVGIGGGLRMLPR